MAQRRLLARVLGKDPDDAWEWVIRFLLVIVVLTIGFAGVGAVFGKEKSGGQPAPAPVVVTSGPIDCPVSKTLGGEPAPVVNGPCTYKGEYPSDIRIYDRDGGLIGGRTP